MGLKSIILLFAIASVHQDLHKEQLIIILKQVRHLINHELFRAVRTKCCNIDFLVPLGLALSFCLTILFKAPLNKCLHEFALILKLIYAILLTLFKHFILTLSHVIGHHGIVLLVIFEVEVVFFFAIGCKLRLVLWDEVFDPFTFRNGSLLCFQTHHFFDHLKLGHFGLLHFYGVTFFINWYFRVHANQTLPEATLNIVDANPVTHLCSDHIFHFLLR